MAARLGKKIRKDCKNCDKRFTPVKNWQKFCGPECRVQWHKEWMEDARKLKRVQEREEEVK